MECPRLVLTLGLDAKHTKQIQARDRPFSPCDGSLISSSWITPDKPQRRIVKNPAAKVVDSALGCPSTQMDCSMPGKEHVQNDKT